METMKRSNMPAYHPFRLLAVVVLLAMLVGTATIQSATAGKGRRCDPNYKRACIKITSRDLDCDDVKKTNFKSVGSDPHGFDGDNDGWACES
jgi:hypothetical protein